jgi:2-desacetyl-2-hydroxyethyl bacteriochlorophyllide A dehydrogenase
MSKTTFPRSTMRAVRLDTARQSYSLETVPIPEPQAGEVRLKVEYAGLCHTDLHFIDGELAARMPEKVTLGHEIAGTIDSVGSGISEWRAGDRVLVSPIVIVDGQTVVLGVHLDGGWADYVVVPVQSLVRVDTGIPLDQATVIADAVSTAWSAIRSTAAVQPGESVAVWGLGGLGYHAVQLLRMIGAAPVIGIDPNPAARDRATLAGADHVLDPRASGFADELDALTNGRGLDAAFDFYGSTAVQQQGFDALATGGRLVLIGIPDAPLSLQDNARLIRLRKSVLGHYGQQKSDLEELVRFVGYGRLDLSRSVTEVVALDEVATAIDHLRRQVGDPIRILLRP